MKVKIKKKGNTKTFNLINSWKDVTLEKWIKLIELDDKNKSEEALETITALSDIPKKLVKELGIQDIALMMTKISELQSKADSSLKNIIEVNGKEYGFHPEISEITLGEWSDIETMIQDGIDKNMPQIMAVLYRPIIEKKNEVYIIEAYDGKIDIRAEEFKKMSAGQVEGALRFFFALGKESLKILPLFLMERLAAIGKAQ
jgi:hypothetical protein